MESEKRLKLCGDCIHADICKEVIGGWFSPKNPAYCKGFKDRTKYVEVVHGRWHKPTPCSQEFCINCGLTPKTNFGWLPPYCPNCGAKMDGERKDNERKAD